MFRIIWTRTNLLTSCLICLTMVAFSVAYRNGATEDSCADQSVEHVGFPPIFTRPCIARCLVNFTLVGRVNPDFQVIDPTATFSSITCGSLYRSKQKH